MKAIELTKNEREILEAIVANAKKVGDSGVEFILQDVARETGKSIRSVSATTGSLAKKGMLLTANGDSYFDGELTEAGLHEVESSKVNNNQEVKTQSNKSKNMATKANKTVKVEDSKSVTNAVDNFDAPVMDERILKLNELKAVKMANLSKGKRPAAKEAKELATYILNNWDNLAELKNIKSEDVTNEDLQNILASRLKNFEDASKAAEKAVKEAEKAEKAPKAKTEKKETKKTAPAKSKKADSKKAEPKAKEEKKDEPKVAKTARKVGDVHPKHPTWVWTEYAEGKFDWRTNPADKKQGQRTDKMKKEEKGTKEEPKKASKASKGTAKQSKKAEPNKESKAESKAPKMLTIDEFRAMPKQSRSGKKMSKAQEEAFKLIMKGYWIEVKTGPLGAEYAFLVNKGGDRKQCYIDSVKALFKRYGLDYIPEGLIK